MVQIGRALTVLAFALGTRSIAAAQPLPAELSALAVEARLDLPVTDWCRGQFQTGHPGAYAVAVTAAKGAAATSCLNRVPPRSSWPCSPVVPEIACYTPAAARALDLEIKSSSTIDGQITAPWTTAVVCAFLENTRARCCQWQPKTAHFGQLKTAHFGERAVGRRGRSPVDAHAPRRCGAGGHGATPSRRSSDADRSQC